jgi:hypothetical protein
VTDDATPANPIVGAAVTLREMGLTARTDAEGRFAFANLSPGTYTLRATAPGYQPASKPVDVPAGDVDAYRLKLTQ